MTDLRTAAQQALEALEFLSLDFMMLDLISPGREAGYKAITALRAALAEHDKKIVWVEERKAHWAEQLQLARETQERERQQREEAALAEPVAWLWRHRETGRTRLLMPNERTATDVAAAFDVVGPLYLAPPQRKPLTDEEIRQIALDTPIGGTNFARAIERAHGIGGQNE